MIVRTRTRQTVAAPAKRYHPRIVIAVGPFEVDFSVCVIYSGCLVMVYIVSVSSTSYSAISVVLSSFELSS